MRKVIFLDIDGVLNDLAWNEKTKHLPDYHDINPDKVRLLANLVHQTKAELVLSSTWRCLAATDTTEEHPMYTYLRKSLQQENLTLRDHTPQIPSERPEEIRQWLIGQSSPETIRFVSLDDDWNEQEYQKVGLINCLIHTEYFSLNGGLLPEHIKIAVKMLNGTKPQWIKTKGGSS